MFALVDTQTDRGTVLLPLIMTIALLILLTQCDAFPSLVVETEEKM